MSLRQSSLENSQISRFFGQSANIKAVVITDPNRTVNGSYSFIARVENIGNSSINYSLRVPIRVITPNKDVTELLPGQHFTTTARIVQSKEARVAALVLIAQKVVVSTKASRWALVLGSIRRGLRIHSGGGDSGALIPGMM